MRIRYVTKLLEAEGQLLSQSASKGGLLTTHFMHKHTHKKASFASTEGAKEENSQKGIRLLPNHTATWKGEGEENKDTWCITSFLFLSFPRSNSPAAPFKQSCGNSKCRLQLLLLELFLPLHHLSASSLAKRRWAP